MSPLIHTPHFILFAVSAFFVFVLALPVARMLLRKGHTGIAMSPDPVQSAVRFWMLLALVGAAVWALVLGLVGPESVHTWAVPAPVQNLGMVVSLIGLGVIVVAQAQMGASWRIGIDDNPTALVKSGLFRLTRNPIYTGIFISLAGLVMLAPGPWSVLGTLAIVMLISIQTRLEEKHLQRLHGEAFATWAAQTGRFMPWLGRLTS